MVLPQNKTIEADDEAAHALVALLGEVRRRTLQLVCHLDEGDLVTSHDAIMSPLVWDLAHIAAYEDLWLSHRHAGLPLLRPDLAGVYDAFETPRAARTSVELLDPAQTFEYMERVRARSLATIEGQGVGDGFLHALVARHELQHTETMLQTMAIADLLPDEASWHPLAQDCEDDEGWVELDGGAFSVGASPHVFAYDNERPSHEVRLSPFRIAATPVSVREWRAFEQEGGYERRSLWSKPGWAWLQDATRAHRERAGGQEAPNAPKCNISFYEAEAYANARGARLPTEGEWEVAARLAGESLRCIGAVWEWTSSTFAGYPGFTAFPYKEYSEVFFDRGYKVLRGGSWATHPLLATTTFRNWDLPQRSQIFAGLRLATDL